MVKPERIKDFGRLVRIIIFTLTAIIILKANPIHRFNSDATLKTFSNIALIGAFTSYFFGVLVVSTILWIFRWIFKIGILEAKEGSVQISTDGFGFSAALLIIALVFKVIIGIR